MTLFKLIVENKVDIKKFCLQFMDNWNSFYDNILLTTISHSKKEELNLLFMNLIKDQLSIFAPLHPTIEWEKFGYKYSFS